MRLDSVLYKYEILSQICYIQRYLSSANFHVSGVYCTETCCLHSKMNIQVLCSMFFLRVLPECCAAALLTKGTEAGAWGNNGATDTALVPKSSGQN